MPEKNRKCQIALVLSGGGARGAYQAGVLKGIAAIAKQCGVQSPFNIITGVSAGAINGACAAGAHHETGCAEKVSHFWADISTEKVFRLDFYSITRIGASWAADLAFGGFYAKGKVPALLDTSPLRKLLSGLIDFKNIQQRINSRDLTAFCVTATDYSTANSISFVSSAETFTPWRVGTRHSEKTAITLEHIMGSCAIPLFFPPAKVGGRYLGDGCLRNTAPLSPAIHLGAEKLIIIGVRHKQTHPKIPETNPQMPTLGRIFGVVLNAVLLDATETDVLLLEKTNTLAQETKEQKKSVIPIRNIEHLTIAPSLDISEIAFQETKHAPRMLRYLLGGWGNEKETAELMSYLFFERPFCNRLIELGLRDALALSSEIAKMMIPTETPLVRADAS